MNESQRLRVVLRDRAGASIADARVMIEAGPQPTADIAALSDDRGVVTLGVPAPGRYSLLCAAEGYVTARCDVDVNGETKTEVDIVMTRSD